MNQSSEKKSARNPSKNNQAIVIKKIDDTNKKQEKHSHPFLFVHDARGNEP